jgi:hypothetical protein
MPLTDISLLFKDIIETPQQKAVRLAREGQAAASQYTGLPTGLRALAMGTASRIPGTVESIRQFGAGVGLPVQTQGEQLQRSMGGLNITDPTDQAEMVRLLANINPASAAAAAGIFREEEQRLEDRAAQQEFRTLQTRKLQAELDEPVGWKPMGSIRGGKFEVVWVSDSGQIQDYARNLLVGEARPKNVFPVSMTAEKLSGLGLDPAIQGMRERQAIGANFIRGMGDAVLMLRDMPAGATLLAKAANLWNSLKQNVEWFQPLEEYNRTFSLEEKANFEKRLDDLGVAGAEFRALMTSLAYQKAKELQGESERISDQDLNTAMDALGGDTSDADALERIMINNIQNTVRNFQSDWDILVGQDKEAMNAAEALGYNRIAELLGLEPDLSLDEAIKQAQDSL